MNTTWKLENVKKTTTGEEYTKLTLKDYRGETTYKIDNIRHFVQDCDKYTGY